MRNLILLLTIGMLYTVSAQDYTTTNKAFGIDYESMDENDPQEYINSFTYLIAEFFERGNKILGDKQKELLAGSEMATDRRTKFNLKNQAAGWGYVLVSMGYVINRLKIMSPKITFTDLPEGVIARTTTMDCNISGSKKSADYKKWDDDSSYYMMCSFKLEIDLESLKKMDKTEKFWTMYHELGHAVLSLDHGDGGDLMNPSTNGGTSMTDLLYAADGAVKHYTEAMIDKAFENLTQF